MTIENKPLSIPRNGLIAEYLLDGSALDTNDGTKNNGTATNVTYANTSVGYQKQAGVFNGSSSKVDCPVGGLKNNFSVSMWTTKGDADGVAFSMYNSWCRIYSDGTVTSSFFDGSDRGINSTSGYVTDSNLHHLVWVKTSTVGQALYIDGVKVAENTSHNGNLSTGYTGNPGIGYFRTFNANYTSATIQSVRLYNYALSTQEIQNLYLEGKRMLGNYGSPDLFKDCVAYYDFRGDARDVVGGYDGTVTGATLTTDRFGIANSAYSFTSPSQYVSLGNVFNFSGTTHYTISVWVKPNASTAEIPIISKFEGGWYQWICGLRNGKAMMHRQVSPWGFEGNTTISTTEWTNITYVYNGNLNIYVNGVSDLTPVASGSIASSSSDVKIGWNSYHGNAGQYYGAIGSVQVFQSKALSADEVKALYQETLTKKPYPFSKSLPGSLKNGLVLDMNSGGYDESGNGNHGTLVNSPTVARRFQSKGLKYNGSNQYATVPDNASLNLSSDFSVSAWLYWDGNNPGGTNDWATVWDNYLPSKYFSLLRFQKSTSGNIQFITGNRTIINVPHNFVPGKKYLVTARVQGNTQTLLINNSVIFENSSSDSQAKGSGTKYIGRQDDATYSYYIGGELYDVLFHERPISNIEHSQLFYSTYLQ